jgi:hypothetical protein
MSEELPIDPNNPAGNFVVDLDGKEYRFWTTYNRRADLWTISILEPNGTPIVMGAGVAAGWAVFRGITDDRLPPGTLLAYDSSGNGESPGEGELGARVKILYFPESDDG